MLTELSRLGGQLLIPRQRQAARRDEQTGLGTRASFTADLADAVAAAEPGRLVLALVGLHGLDELTRHAGRRWADLQLLAATDAISSFAACDRFLQGYRVGVHTVAVVLTRTAMEEAFGVAQAVLGRVHRDTDQLVCTVGLAVLDGTRCADAETLELAADAALDRAIELAAADGCGRVVAAADQSSGLRWVASRPSRPTSSASAAV